MIILRSLFAQLFALNLNAAAPIALPSLRSNKGFTLPLLAICHPIFNTSNGILKPKREKLRHFLCAFFLIFFHPFLPCLLVIFIVCTNKGFLLALDEQIDEYSVCTGRLNRTTDGLACVSELCRVTGSSPSVDTIIYLGLQPHHLLQTDENTQRDLLNLHRCTQHERVDYGMFGLDRGDSEGR